MKNNNKGFIAISLIYSFFLVFLITLLAVVTDYAHNRILLNDVKKETQEYLNELAVFNPVYLKSKKNELGEIINYDVNEEVAFSTENWNVIEDDGSNVTLILNRTLTEEEITSALSTINLTSVMEGNATLMCLQEYSPAICNYVNAYTYNNYSWSVSIVKRIVDYWFLNNKYLQKARGVGSLVIMNFSDGETNYNSHVRIPTTLEYDRIQDNDIWYLTKDSITNGISYIRIGEETLETHTTYKSIRPVIMVKKLLD